ncbi:hypothetical protein [Ammoniphilus sp. 3BR4]|uniref:hypothetical protein n=1 Tax=Ammoniphilus sp. 3BR4 TaxID=3158265 RepID=UPI003466A303
MNIYGHIKSAINELDNHIFSMPDVQATQVVEGIKKSWDYLQEFMKNIQPDFTSSFQHRLGNLDANDILITNDMVKEAYSIFKTMKHEPIDVKIFMLRYIWLTKTLLIFNKPHEYL